MNPARPETRAGALVALGYQSRDSDAIEVLVRLIEDSTASTRLRTAAICAAVMTRDPRFPDFLETNAGKGSDLADVGEADTAGVLLLAAGRPGAAGAGVVMRQDPFDETLSERPVLFLL